MPSEWYETAGISILEAGALGRAAIVSDNTAMEEIIENEVNGLVFPMGNAEKLATNIRRICYDPKFAERLGVAARERSESVYDSEGHYRKLMEIYERVV
jgi:glycosyltransferase involved in cell wall biosynthesis